MKTTCSKCGYEGWNEIGHRLGRCTLRCESCGDESWVHVSEADYDPRPLEKRGARFALVGWWPLVPTARQISDVRALLPQLRTLALSDLRRRALKYSSIHLGYFSEIQINALQPVLEQAGMMTRRSLDV